MAHVCQLYSSVTPVRISVTEQFITKRTTPSSVDTAQGQQGPHRRKKPAITNCSTTQRKPKSEISHLQPDFILKPLPQQCLFLSKLQFKLCHIFHCNPNGRGFLGGFSISIFICTNLASQSEISASGRNDSRIYTCLSHYRVQAKKKNPIYLFRIKILNFIKYV